MCLLTVTLRGPLSAPFADERSQAIQADFRSIQQNTCIRQAYHPSAPHSSFSLLVVISPKALAHISTPFLRTIFTTRLPWLTKFSIDGLPSAIRLRRHEIPAFLSPFVVRRGCFVAFVCIRGDEVGILGKRYVEGLEGGSREGLGVGGILCIGLWGCRGLVLLLLVGHCAAGWSLENSVCC